PSWCPNDRVRRPRSCLVPFLAVKRTVAGVSLLAPETALRRAVVVRRYLRPKWEVDVAVRALVTRIPRVGRQPALVDARRRYAPRSEGAKALQLAQSDAIYPHR